MRIGVLGLKGSYSEKAAKQWIAENVPGEDNNLEHCSDIQDVFSLLENEECDIGVVPLENSIEGSVGVTLDLLLEKDVTIIGEAIVTIEHCLLSNGRKEDIKVILSHPQALGQCRNFVKKTFPLAELRTTGSTSHAAKLAMEFEEMAAIASPETADVYKLDILMPDIQDRKHNHTRFVVIARSETAEDLVKSLRLVDSDIPYKTSIIVYLDRDRPGALYSILGEFAGRNINLTRIESRPSKKVLGDYVFYIDFEGKISDDIIKDAIYNIESSVGMLKMLGSYPELDSGCKSN
ncbi:prephenate dehydratase [Methanolobus tindarius DSM 2278]|uniref:prephenate dehydratase n=1 Tax=Methanolobus tindarius DSM 2278 TaxID=1090322 RepID=W9DTS9_METTI|nr:prephenate dehydratase [Methanolobus tindarius]ETA69208.1 prephenate dehydratase [Methanolobus tindarius DSM 2278]